MEKKKKTRMVWLPEAEGKKTFVNMFTRFDRIHERDGRTDRWAPHEGMGCYDV